MPTAPTHQPGPIAAAESSPVHRAVWERDVPLELFDSVTPAVPEATRAVVDHAVAIVARRHADGSIYGDDGLIAADALAELSEAGFFGLGVSVDYGGSGVSFAQLASFIIEMAAVDPWVAGLLSLQAGLGPVGYLEALGSAEQKRRFLPRLARGELLGAFAVTEPGTSSDLAAIRTVARREGDTYLVSGEKLFITNAVPGHLAGVMCLIDGRSEMLLVELPEVEDEHFHLVRYPLRALTHLPNAGLAFRELPVPAENLVASPTGDGRQIAYRALNRARIAVGANAAGMMRRMAASLVPWVHTRETFGAPIGTRELVQRRLGGLASGIAGAEALALWASQLLDQGHRGELEAVTAKVFGSEAQKRAAVDVLLRTHGGRALIAGNLFADNVHDLLAPVIYEGENEIITLAFLASLTKAHRTRYLEPIGHALGRAPGNEGTASPGSLWSARRTLAAYAQWLAKGKLEGIAAHRHDRVPGRPEALTEVALAHLRACGVEISAALRRGNLAKHQATAFELAQRVQAAATMLVTSRYAARVTDPVTQLAATCQAMQCAVRLSGARPTGEYQRMITELGAAVTDDQFPGVAGLEHPPAAMAHHLVD